MVHAKLKHLVVLWKNVLKSQVWPSTSIKGMHFSSLALAL